MSKNDVRIIMLIINIAKVVRWIQSVTFLVIECTFCVVVIISMALSIIGCHAVDATMMKCAVGRKDYASVCMMD
jgi:hypothetical protein